MIIMMHYVKKFHYILASFKTKKLTLIVFLEIKIN